VRVRRANTNPEIPGVKTRNSSNQTIREQGTGVPKNGISFLFSMT